MTKAKEKQLIRLFRRLEIPTEIKKGDVISYPHAVLLGEIESILETYKNKIMRVL